MVMCVQVYEETGFDIRELIKDEHYLEYQSQDNERASRMYIIPGVPEETEFKPRVRKEIRVNVCSLSVHKAELLSFMHSCTLRASWPQLLECAL